MRILVIEDDHAIAETIRSGLVDQHYYVDVAYDGEQGSDLAWSNDYDLIVLDLMLPKINGREVCRMLRCDGVVTPILMLTALSSEDDIITGLDLGADDYLVKPFSFAVLLARARSLMRRRTELKVSEIQIADLRVDTVSRIATRGGRALNLTAKEFALLEYFALNRGRILARDAISEHVWDMHFDPRSNVIESLIRCLRQKVDRGFEPPLIHTVRGIGYRFCDGN